jgi:hypothetical protein
VVQAIQMAENELLAGALLLIDTQRSRIRVLPMRVD